MLRGLFISYQAIGASQHNQNPVAQSVMDVAGLVPSRSVVVVEQREVVIGLLANGYRG